MKIENYSITFTKETNLIFNLFSNFMIENKLSEYTPDLKTIHQKLQENH